MDEIDTKQLIIEAYLDIVETNMAVPVQSDFVEYGIKRGAIRYHFGNMENLHRYISNNHKNAISEYFSTVDNVFKGGEYVEQNMNKKKYVVTTAVADAKAHKGFLDSIKHYCKTHDASIIIMPCESITNSFERRTATFDKEFNNEDYIFVTDDTQLNENISLCSIQVSAKQIKPITGLNRIGHREGSYVFASPKQFLEYVPTGHSRGKNYAVMTPGACTKPSYYSDTFVSKRLSYIADHDHTYGALIIEIEDDKTFHFRQVQADEEGKFIDLGVMYSPEGTTKDVETNVILGDVHAAQVDKDVVDSFIGAMKDINIKRCFLHDIFDGHSINHHITTIGERAMRALYKEQSLEEELRVTWSVINHIREGLGADHTYVVKSNHDEFLDRYLKEGRYIDDPENHYISLKIAPSLFGELCGDPLVAGLILSNGIETFENITFLRRDSDVTVGGSQCAAHGDLGLNGAKSSLNGLEKIYGNCVVGHVHSAAIQRGVFRVGTFTKMDMGYNRGPSSWTHTACLLYENGQRQLINCVNGKFYKDQEQNTQ